VPNDSYSTELGLDIEIAKQEKFNPKYSFL
ncbi:unnamed protein product, partial [marine sediment metagenome]